MHSLALPLLLALQASAGAAQQDGEPVACERHLEDSCWGDVTAHVDCLLNPRSARSRECERGTADQLCRSLEDALRCSSEMDPESAGCVLKSGQENFDFWIRGLEAVNTKLCFEGLMANIVSHAVCWDTLRFTRCVQHSVEQLQHVVDLASLPAGAESAPHLGPREHCHLSMLRVAKCAALAASKDPAPDVPPPDDHPAGVPFNFCAQAPPVDVLNDLLAAYFSASECGGACPTPPSQRQQPTPAEPELPQVSEAELGHRPTPKEQLPFLCGSAASAAHSTTLLSIVIAVLVKFL